MFLHKWIFTQNRQDRGPILPATGPEVEISKVGRPVNMVEIPPEIRDKTGIFPQFRQATAGILTQTVVPTRYLATELTTTPNKLLEESCDRMRSRI